MADGQQSGVIALPTQLRAAEAQPQPRAVCMTPCVRSARSAAKCAVRNLRRVRPDEPVATSARVAGRATPRGFHSVALGALKSSTPAAVPPAPRTPAGPLGWCLPGGGLSPDAGQSAAKHGQQHHPCRSARPRRARPRNQRLTRLVTEHPYGHLYPVGKSVGSANDHPHHGRQAIDAASEIRRLLRAAIHAGSADYLPETRLGVAAVDPA